MSQSIFGQVIAWLNESYERRKAIRHLSKLDDHLLRDMGLEPSEIHNAVDGNFQSGNLPIARPANPPGSRQRGFVLRPGTSRGILR